MDDIQMAQVVAGENAVVERLRAKGLLPPESRKERRITPDERYRSGWCCDYDFETGQYRTGDCIGPTRNADVCERELARKLIRAVEATEVEQGWWAITLKHQILTTLRDTCKKLGVNVDG